MVTAAENGFICERPTCERTFEPATPRNFARAVMHEESDAAHTQVVPVDRTSKYVVSIITKGGPKILTEELYLPYAHRRAMEIKEAFGDNIHG